MGHYSFSPLSVLIIDDEEQTLKSCEIALRSSGIENIICCKDSRDVDNIISQNDIGVVLLDLSMPFITGEELLKKITADYPQITIIIITGANDIDTAVRCIRAGASDYIVKPLERSRLISGVRRLLEIRELQRENRLLKEQLLSNDYRNSKSFSKIITKNEKMLSIFKYVEAIAITEYPVLITGETGVGKELMAKAIHDLSGRKGEFVAVNVSGLDDNIFSDTLFGHKKGAFTGADSHRPGLVEKSSGGTLFLDEIGDLNGISQVKLLRLLQEREYFPLGSDVAKRMDARILVATNQDLQFLMNSGHFRKDLYYRLLTHHIIIPPLRDRKDDIPMLTNFFIEKAAVSCKKPLPAAPPELNSLLLSYHFPGNIRELKSMIYDAVSKHQSKKMSLDIFKERIFGDKNFSDDTLEKKPDFSPNINFSEKIPTLKEGIKFIIDEALRRANGNQTIAASMLGISQQALSKRLKKSDDSE